MAHSTIVLSVIRVLVLKPALKGSLSLHTLFFKDSLLLSIDSNRFNTWHYCNFPVVSRALYDQLFCEHVELYLWPFFMGILY